jgi:hypothetical protein
MAIATLNSCYNNADVFTGVVKIRKGCACKLILRTNTPDEVHDTFYQFSQGMLRKAETNRSQGVLDPSYSRTVKICRTIMETTAEGHNRERKARQLPWMASLLVPAVGVAASMAMKGGDVGKKLPQSLALLGLGAFTFTPYLLPKSSGLTDSKDLVIKTN